MVVLGLLFLTLITEYGRAPIALAMSMFSRVKDAVIPTNRKRLKNS